MKKLLLTLTVIVSSCGSLLTYAQAELNVRSTTFGFTQALDQAGASFRIENRGDQRSRRFRVKMWVSTDDLPFTDDDIVDILSEDISFVSARGTGRSPEGVATTLLPGPDGFFDGIEPTVRINRRTFWVVDYRFNYQLPLSEDTTAGGQRKPKSEILGDNYHFQACIIFFGQSDCDPDPRFTRASQSVIVPPVVQNVATIGDNQDELQLTWSEVPFDDFVNDAGVPQSVDFVDFYRIERIDHNRVTTVTELPPSAFSRVIVDGQERFTMTFGEAEGVVRGKRNSFTVESCHNTSASTTPTLVCFPRSARQPNTGLGNVSGAIEREFNASQGSNSNGVFVAWEEPTSGVLRYRVKRCLEGSDQGCTEVELAGSNTSFLDVNAQRGRLYEYTISACDRVFQNPNNPSDPRIGRCIENGVEVYKFGTTNAGFRGLVDEYENDDTPQQATVIVNSVQQLHSFDSPVDDDWVRVDLRKPSRLSIETASFGNENVDTVLSLFDESGNLLFENDDSNPSSNPAGFSKIETELLPQGSYFIRATHFKLPIDGFPAPTANNYLLNVEILDRNPIITAIIQLLLDDD